MQIRKTTRGDLLTLSVDGILDNESTGFFRETIDESIRGGWHRILLDLQNVPYLSSAGIGALLEARKKIEQLHGFFGVCQLAADVEQILHQTRVLNLLKCDPETITATAVPGTRTLHLSPRMSFDELASYELYDQQPKAPLKLELWGDSSRIQNGVFTEQDCHSVDFANDRFGFGLGAIGPNFEASRQRFGEFLAAGGGVGQSSKSHHGLPDYLVAQEDFVPRVQILCGCRFGGDFSELIRFEARQPDAPLPLSSLLSQALDVTRSDAAAIVVLAECAGLVGAKLKRSPVDPVTEGKDRFQFPEIRDWLSYCSEQGHRHSLVLTVGLVCRDSKRSEFPVLAPFLHPLTAETGLAGHFHAAAFPYRPLKKRTLDLSSLVEELFVSGNLQDVLHLISDRRPVIGAGESSFLTGGCWVAPLNSSTKMEVVR